MLDTTGGKAGDDGDSASGYSGLLFGWMRRRRLGGSSFVFKLKMTLKTGVVPSRFCKSTTLLIAQVAWTPPA